MYVQQMTRHQKLPERFNTKILIQQYNQRSPSSSRIDKDTAVKLHKYIHTYIHVVYGFIFVSVYNCAYTLLS